MVASARVVVLVAGLALCTGCRPLSSHPVAVTAIREVTTSERVADALGQPVTCDPQVRGVASESNGIASLTFGVKGPKGAGTIAVDARKTQGEWAVTGLVLRPADGGKDIMLMAEIETDTPKFDPSAAPAAPTTPVAPPGEVEITLPPGVPGG